MSFATEQTYRNAVQTARAIRQQSKAAARITYTFDPANLAAYIVALNDAEATYVTSVNTAANTLDVPIGSLGIPGNIPGAPWTPLQAIA